MAPVCALPIALHAINLDFKVREFETTQEGGTVMLVARVLSSALYYATRNCDVSK